MDQANKEDHLNKRRPESLVVYATAVLQLLARDSPSISRYDTSDNNKNNLNNKLSTLFEMSNNE